MKKLSIVLLALLFVTGTAFAAFDISVGGEASASYEFDLDDSELSYGVDSDDIDFGFNIDLAVGDAESVGEGGVYAVLKASASLSIDTDYFLEDVFEGSSESNDDDAEDGFVILKSSGIDEFKIYAGDFIIDFLGWPDEWTKASSWVLDGDDDPFDFVKGGYDGDGISVTYSPLGVTVGGLVIHDDSGDLFYDAYAGWKGEAVEGLNLELVAGLSGTENAFDGFDVSLAAAYALDMVDFSVATDMVKIGNPNDEFAVDVALNAVVDLDVVKPAIDVYFAHNFAYNSTDDEDIRMYDELGMNKTDLTDLWIRAKVSDFDLGFGMLDFSVFGETMLEEDRWFYGADATVALADLPVEVGVNAGIGALKSYDFGGNVSYTYEGIKLYGEGGLKSYDSDNNPWKVPMKFGVSSSTLVDNAVLDLNWDTGDVRTSNGAITASVTVSF